MATVYTTSRCIEVQEYFEEIISYLEEHNSMVLTEEIATYDDFPSPGVHIKTRQICLFANHIVEVTE